VALLVAVSVPIVRAVRIVAVAVDFVGGLHLLLGLLNVGQAFDGNILQRLRLVARLLLDFFSWIRSTCPLVAAAVVAVRCTLRGAGVVSFGVCLG